MFLNCPKLISACHSSRGRSSQILGLATEKSPSQKLFCCQSTLLWEDWLWHLEVVHCLGELWPGWLHQIHQQILFHSAAVVVRQVAYVNAASDVRQWQPLAIVVEFIGHLNMHSHIWPLTTHGSHIIINAAAFAILITHNNTQQTASYCWQQQHDVVQCDCEYGLSHFLIQARLTSVTDRLSTCRASLRCATKMTGRVCKSRHVITTKCGPGQGQVNKMSHMWWLIVKHATFGDFDIQFCTWPYLDKELLSIAIRHNMQWLWWRQHLDKY